MTIQVRKIPDGEFTFSEADFKAIAKFAYSEFGLNLVPAKKPMVYSRLSKRVRAMRVPDFESYMDIITDPNGSEELRGFLTSLTTNVTHFFREDHHFKLMRDRIFPPLLAAARNGKRVRVWSAGCSSGQEPFSIALTLLKMCPDVARLDVKILATDIDPDILERARAATYPLEELASIPVELQRLPNCIEQKNAATFTMGSAPRALVQFGELNMIRDWPMRGPFDIVVCRNVAIYFDTPTQQKVWSRFSDMINEGGYLIIGHSERLTGNVVGSFASVGVTTYLKTGKAGALPAGGLKPAPVKGDRK